MGGGPGQAVTATIRADCRALDSELEIVWRTRHVRVRTIRRLYREATEDYAEGKRCEASGLAKAEQARKLQRQVMDYEAMRRTPNLGL